MIYTGLLSLLLAEYAANQKCSAVLLCSADSIYPLTPTYLGSLLLKGERRKKAGSEEGREEFVLCPRKKKKSRRLCTTVQVGACTSNNTYGT